MAEIKHTCATCRWLHVDGQDNKGVVRATVGECRVWPHAIPKHDPTRDSCREHSELELQRERLWIASEQMAAIIPMDSAQGLSPRELAHDAFNMADALLAEAERRQGGE